jgi:hypothetical protein
VDGRGGAKGGKMPGEKWCECEKSKETRCGVRDFLDVPRPCALRCDADDRRVRLPDNAAALRRDW